MSPLWTIRTLSVRVPTSADGVIPDSYQLTSSMGSVSSISTATATTAAVSVPPATVAFAAETKPQTTQKLSHKKTI